MKQRKTKASLCLCWLGCGALFHIYSCCVWQQNSSWVLESLDSTFAIIWKSCCQLTSKVAYMRHLLSLPGTSPTIRAAAQSAAIFYPVDPPTACLYGTLTVRHSWVAEREKIRQSALQISVWHVRCGIVFFRRWYVFSYLYRQQETVSFFYI